MVGSGWRGMEGQRERHAIAFCYEHNSCILTSAAPRADDVRVAIVQYALAAELSLHVECFLSAALCIVGSFLNNTLAADLFDDVVGRIHAIYGVGGATCDVVFPVVQCSLAADLLHVIVRPTIAAIRIWNCHWCCCQ